MHKRTFFWRSLTLALPLILSLCPSLSHAACNAGDVGGAAYLELPVAPGGMVANVYGQREANEIGLAGITVKVTDGAGTEQSVTTDASGAWSVTAPVFPVRVEFTPTAGLRSGSAGSQSQSSVRFVDAASCNADMGFQRPEDYSQPDPRMAIPSYQNGTGVGLADGGLFSFLRSSHGLNQEFKDALDEQGTGPIPLTEASIDEVGSLWGIGWQVGKKRLFASSFLKRHVGVRKGLGYVYVFDETTVPGSLAGNFNLQGVTPANGGGTIDLGTVCRDAVCAADPGYSGNAADYTLPDDKYAWSFDIDAFYKVGTVGFGDIDMQPNSNTLWLINANQKALISVDVSGDTAALPGTVNQYLLGSLGGVPNCNGGQLHPWGLGFMGGKGFVGLTCDAIDSQQASDLHAYVMSFDPANVGAGLSPVLDFPLDYPRDSGKPFEPWMTTATATSKLMGTHGHIDFPHGILSDIEFDERGNLYLAIMDLFSHQMGNDNHYPFTSNPDAGVTGITNGDVLKACKTSSGFSLEGSADCPVNTVGSFGPYSAGEFFADVAGDDHKEGTNGAFALLQGSGELNVAQMDPHPAGVIDHAYWSMQGVSTYSLEDGNPTNWYAINYTFDRNYMGKAGGVGDIELLTDPSPVEIGNRVWLDSNDNGIQDAGEAGIPNVEVKLLAADGVTELATATTAADGTYYFSSAAGTSTASAIYGVSALQPGTAYTLKFPTAVTVSGAAYKPTTVTAGDNREIDSNASSAGLVPITTMDIPMAGANNHSFDVGYVEVKVDVALTKTVEPATAKRGETVVYTLTVTNTGEGVATGVKVVDKLPAGLTFVSHDGASPAVYDAITGEWDVGTVGLGAANAVSLKITATVQ